MLRNQYARIRMPNFLYRLMNIGFDCPFNLFAIISGQMKGGIGQREKKRRRKKLKENEPEIEFKKKNIWNKIYLCYWELAEWIQLKCAHTQIHTQKSTLGCEIAPVRSTNQPTVRQPAQWFIQALRVLYHMFMGNLCDPDWCEILSANGKWFTKPKFEWMSDASNYLLKPFAVSQLKY